MHFFYNRIMYDRRRLWRAGGRSEKRHAIDRRGRVLAIEVALPDLHFLLCRERERGGQQGPNEK